MGSIIEYFLVLNAFHSHMKCRGGCDWLFQLSAPHSLPCSSLDFKDSWMLICRPSVVLGAKATLQLAANSLPIATAGCTRAASGVPDLN